MRPSYLPMRIAAGVTSTNSPCTMYSTASSSVSGIGGVTTWRDAAEFLALGAGNVQVCTAAMTYGFKVVQEMISGLSEYMDDKGMTSVDQLVRRAVPNVTDWNQLNLNYVAKAKIDQDLCIIYKYDRIVHHDSGE